MLPYVEQPVLTIGSFQLEAFTVLVGVAIVVQFQIVLRRAPQYGIDRRTASTLSAWAIGLGLVGAHVFDLLFYRPQVLLDDPLDLFRVWSELSSFGGMLGGIAGLLVVMRLKRLGGRDMLRFVDCLLFALPFTLAIGRLGCGLKHDHPGVSSAHWLAVAYPDGPRFDLGLLEFFYCSLLAALFLVIDRWRPPEGFYIGAFFLLYGPVRFTMDTLRTGEARYLDWTPGQYYSIVATLAGMAILALVFRRRPHPG